MEKKVYDFKAIMRKNPTLNSGFIEFPLDAEKEFGKKGQIKVKATFDGYEYRGSLCRMGSPFHWIGITQKIRQAIGKNPGDEVHVIIEQDLEERKVTVPDDFAEALKSDTIASNLFEKLSYTHKREYVMWIDEAKKAETRTRRIEKAIEKLQNGKKEPR